MSTLWQLLQTQFAQRALLVGAAVSVCAAVLGVILVLRKLTMIGHALGDVGFFGTTLVMALGWSGNPLLATIAPMVIVVIGSFVIMWLSQKNNSGDVVIGMAATGALALGIMLTALSQGMNSDLLNTLFGSILSLSATDMTVALVLSFVVLLGFVLCYNRFFIMTYDADFAKTRGLSVSWYNGLFSLMAALVVSVGMRMMGSLLISCLIIFPAISARLWVKSFRGLVVLAAVLSLVCFIIGFVLTALTRIPTGSGIVGAHIVVWVVSLCCRRLRRG